MRLRLFRLIIFVRLSCCRGPFVTIRWGEVGVSGHRAAVGETSGSLLRPARDMSSPFSGSPALRAVRVIATSGKMPNAVVGEAPSPTVTVRLGSSSESRLGRVCAEGYLSWVDLRGYLFRGVRFLQITVFFVSLCHRFRMILVTRLIPRVGNSPSIARRQLFRP